MNEYEQGNGEQHRQNPQQKRFFWLIQYMQQEQLAKADGVAVVDTTRNNHRGNNSNKGISQRKWLEDAAKEQKQPTKGGCSLGIIERRRNNKGFGIAVG